MGIGNWVFIGEGEVGILFSFLFLVRLMFNIIVPFLFYLFYFNIFSLARESWFACSVEVAMCFERSGDVLGWREGVKLREVLGSKLVEDFCTFFGFFFFSRFLSLALGNF